MTKAFNLGSLLDPTGRPVSPIDVRDFDTLDPISDYLETQSGSILDLPMLFDVDDAQWDVEHPVPTQMTGDQHSPDDDLVVRVSTRSLFTSIGVNSPRLCLVMKTGMLDSGANYCITNRLDVLVDVRW